MARGRSSSKGKGWGWGRLGTILLVLLVLAVLGYAFLGNRRVEHLFGVDVEGLFETYVTDALVRDTPYSTEGILKAVETAGWSPTGAAGSLRRKGRPSSVRTYVKEGAEIRVEVAELDSLDRASEYAASIERPNRAVQFDRRVAVLYPRGSTSPQTLASLLRHLRRYRRMVSAADSASSDGPESPDAR